MNAVRRVTRTWLTGKCAMSRLACGHVVEHGPTRRRATPLPAKHRYVACRRCTRAKTKGAGT